MSRLTPSDVDRMVDLYTRQLLACSEIAPLFKCSRQRVWQLLKARGVERKDGGIEVKCAVCGSIVTRTRRRVRTTRQPYCSPACYAAFISRPDYQVNRQSCRRAVAILSGLTPWLHGYVVHHEDGNQGNNDLSNLFAFRTHAEHMTYHRSSLPTLAFSAAHRRWQEIVNPKFS